MTKTLRLSFRLILAILLSLAALSCSGQGDVPPGPDAAPAADAGSAAPAPQPADQLHRGFDVSSHSGNVDWPALAEAGHSFAFVKATEGQDLKDPAFDEHWPAIKRAGIIRGAYHFYVTEDDPKRQAQFFIDTVTLEPGDLAPVVDIELLGHGTKEGLADHLKIWLDMVEKHYGVKPIIYTATNFWDAHLNDQFGDYPLWIAEYEVDQPRLPKGWAEWHLWQNKGDAAIEGVEKSADLSRVNHSGPDLSALIVPE